jgi:hypothetical protein
VITVVAAMIKTVEHTLTAYKLSKLEQTKMLVGRVDSSFNVCHLFVLLINHRVVCIVY